MAQLDLNIAQVLSNLHPRSVILLNIQGAIFKGLGQLDLAVAAYKKALSIKPDYADAWSNLYFPLSTIKT